MYPNADGLVVTNERVWEIRSAGPADDLCLFDDLEPEWPCDDLIAPSELCE